ncbi:uncharacterized protein LOC128961825 [Oppia nitens]|uniref:uncharacterized protein LOC128961825 n=1 Tax=Oppia nitens TaxID=1686743 RepID=UPI0023DC3112|nr:uncharacterized protein LOC128961825 [Oppia nitens]
MALRSGNTYRATLPPTDAEDIIEDIPEDNAEAITTLADDIEAITQGITADMDINELVERMATLTTAARAAAAAREQAIQDGRDARRLVNANTTAKNRLEITEKRVDKQQYAPHFAKTSSKMCESFSGDKSIVPIDEWIDGFNSLVYDYTDSEKLTSLAKHVTGEAYSWYCREVARKRPDITWETCRKKMIARFGRMVGHGIVEASDRRLRGNESVLSYYNDMRRLLDEAEATDKQAVGLLTKGMPDWYKPHLAAQKPKSPEDWFSIAVAIEETRKRQRYPNSDSINDYDDNDRPYDSRKQRNNDLPTKPCPRCLRSGYTEYHWMRLCHRPDARQPPAPRPADENDSTAAVNAIVINDNRHYDVKINDKPVKAFIDHGSELTVLSKEIADYLQLRPDGHGINVKTVAGFKTTLGEVRVDIKLDRQTARVSMQVMDDISYDAIVGIDIADMETKVRLKNQRNVESYSIKVANIPTMGLIKVVGLALPTEPILIKTDVNPIAQQPKPLPIEKLTINETDDQIVNKLIRPSFTQLTSAADEHRKLNANNSLYDNQHEIKAYKIRKPKIINGLIHVAYRGVTKLVVPPSMIANVIKEFHNDTNHHNIEHTFRLVSSKHWWPTLRTDVSNYIKRCHRCRQNVTKRYRKPPIICNVRHDDKYRSSDLRIGDVVEYRIPDSHSTRNNQYIHGPYRIVGQIGHETFRLKQFNVRDGNITKTFVSHSSHLLRYHRYHNSPFTENIPRQRSRHRLLPAESQASHWSSVPTYGRNLAAGECVDSRRSTLQFSRKRGYNNYSTGSAPVVVVV